jgi:chemotaxis protein CheX
MQEEMLDLNRWSEYRSSLFNLDHRSVDSSSIWKEIMQAVGESPAAKSHLDGWQLLLVLSVREVFQTMLATKLAPVFEPSKTLLLEWTAMVGMTGELRGVLMISCDEKSAIAITAKMLGEPPQAANEQTADALGEVCNMVAGNFKHKVNGLSGRCALSPPTVVTGKDYRVHRRESQSLQSLGVTFAFDGAPVCVSLEIQQ